MFKGIKKREFYQLFQSDADCHKYLSEIKWEQGYKCRKCGHQEYFSGKKPHSRRCKSCKHDESATAHTLFHKLKFSISKAFELLFMISTQKKGFSTLGLSEELELRYETCLKFRRKAQKAMESSGDHLLAGNVEVDEFMVGGYDADSPGRSKGNKKLVQVALEVRPNGDFGKGYARNIADFSSESLIQLFESQISKEAQVRTDKWKGYLPVKETYPNLKQEESNKGANFEELHIHIMNIKSWIRGIHHHLSEEYIQRYLDEFHFRFNRRGYRGAIFDKLLKRMMNLPPITHTELT